MKINIKELLQNLELYITIFTIGCFVIGMVYGFFWVICEFIIKIISAIKQ